MNGSTSMTTANVSGSTTPLLGPTNNVTSELQQQYKLTPPQNPSSVVGSQQQQFSLLPPNPHHQQTPGGETAPAIVTLVQEYVNALSPSLE